MRKDPKYPKNHADDKRGRNEMMSGVYGGPAYFAQQDPRMFQTVYGGPEFFTQQSSPAFPIQGAPAPAPEPAAPQTAQDGSRKYCSCCGMPLLEGAKFCIECGAPLPGDDA